MQRVCISDDLLRYCIVGEICSRQGIYGATTGFAPRGQQEGEMADLKALAGITPSGLDADGNVLTNNESEVEQRLLEAVSCCVKSHTQASQLARAMLDGPAVLHHTACLMLLDKFYSLDQPNSYFVGECAVQLLRRQAKRFISSWKTRAFESVFISPTEFIFRLLGDEDQYSAVRVHGSNTYLAILDACLGVKCWRPAYLQDTVNGVFPFLDASVTGNKLHDLILSFITNPRNIGTPLLSVYDPAVLLEDSTIYADLESCIALETSVFSTSPTRGGDNMYTAEMAASETSLELDPYLSAFATLLSPEAILEPLWNHFNNIPGFVEKILGPVFHGFMDYGDMDGSNPHERLQLSDWLFGCFCNENYDWLPCESECGCGASSAKSSPFRHDRFKQLLDFAGITNMDVECHVARMPIVAPGDLQHRRRASVETQDSDGIGLSDNDATCVISELQSHEDRKTGVWSMRAKILEDLMRNGDNLCRDDGETDDDNSNDSGWELDSVDEEDDFALKL